MTLNRAAKDLARLEKVSSVRSDGRSDVFLMVGGSNAGSAVPEAAERVHPTTESLKSSEDVEGTGRENAR